MTRTDPLDDTDRRPEAYGETTGVPTRRRCLVLSVLVGLAAASALWPSPTAAADSVLAVVCATATTAVRRGRRVETTTPRVTDRLTDDPTREADPAVVSLVAAPFETTAGTRRRLRELERTFRARGDRRAVFLTVYARVTEEVADAVERGAFDDPQWVADYLVEFANFYRRAVYDYETGRYRRVPGAWRLAFRAADRDGHFVLQHAALGVNAHVAFDLAFALVGTGLDGDRRTKYRDHHRINLVLWRLVDAILDRLAARYGPDSRTLADAVGPLLKCCWFGALLLGRECAWWVALLVTALRGESGERAAQGVLAAVSTAVARTILGPTAHALSYRVASPVARRLGGTRL